MLIGGIVDRERQDHPETDAPSLHDSTRHLNATCHLEDIVEVEEGAPVPVEATALRQPVRLAPLDDEVLRASRVDVEAV